MNERGEEHMKAITNAWALREVYFDENGEPGMHREPEQAQPVAWISHSDSLLSWDKFYDHMEPLYTAPPQRKPLTDEEIKAVYGNDLNYRDGDYLRFARAIEAKLRGEA